MKAELDKPQAEVNWSPVARLTGRALDEIQIHTRNDPGMSNPSPRLGIARELKGFKGQ